MTMLIYILRRVIEKSKYPIFNVCPMYFFTVGSNKFTRIKEQLIDNEFFSDNQKKVYMGLFSEAQKHYHAFTKFGKIWKNSKYEYYNNDEDLCFNPLSNFPESQKITLLHCNKKYVFRLTDLMNLWNEALKKSENFNPYPTYPRNPFINKAFRRYHLHLIYFKLLESTFSIPLLIQQFYKLEFNIVKFELETYPILKENAIQNYLETESDTTLILDLINMVEALRIDLDYVYIDLRLPTNYLNEIVFIMKPFLKDYFIGSLSCNPLRKELAMTSAINGLKFFFRRYPTFGTLGYYGIESRPTSASEEMDISDSEI